MVNQAVVARVPKPTRPRWIPEGCCTRCGQNLPKLEGVAHQRVCPRRPTEGNGDRRFHLRFETEDSAYWLDLEVDAGATLLDLDRWLRQLWLDCPVEGGRPLTNDAVVGRCPGHRSVFEIWGVGYPIDPPEGASPLEAGSPEGPSLQGRRLDLEVELAQPLRPGVQMQVLYDFMAPTTIHGRVLTELRRRGAEPFEVLIRNRPLRWTCAFCDAAATWICARCRGRRPALVCDEHAEAHARSNGCGGGWLWPVVNSPRMGCCSAAGP